MSAAAPIMIRASLSADEWAELRKLAITRRTSTQTLVAEALRDTYQLTPLIERTDDGDNNKPRD